METYKDINGLATQYEILLGGGDYESAFDFEMGVVRSTLKQYENPLAYEQWYRLTYPAREKLSVVYKNDKRSLRPGPIIFCLPNWSGLAHELALRSVLSGLKSREPNSPVIVAHIAGQDSKDARTFYAGFVNFYIPPVARTLSYSALRGWLGAVETKYTVATIVVVSIYPLAFFLNTLPRTSKIAYWGMKVYPPLLKGIGPNLAAGPNGTKIEINGQVWYGIDIPPLKIASRKKFGSRYITVGTISRKEKILSGNYLEQVIGVARNIPNVRILLSLDQVDLEGRVESGYLRNIDALGWVEPNVTIEKIDIYAEPYPFGGGMMLYLAISRGSLFIIHNDHNTASNLHQSIGYLMRSVDEPAREMMRNYFIANDACDYQKKLWVLIKNYEAIQSEWSSCISKIKSSKYNPDATLGILCE